MVVNIMAVSILIAQYAPRALLIGAAIMLPLLAVPPETSQTLREWVSEQDDYTLSIYFEGLMAEDLKERGFEVETMVKYTDWMNAFPDVYAAPAPEPTKTPSALAPWIVDMITFTFPTLPPNTDAEDLRDFNFHDQNESNSYVKNQAIVDEYMNKRIQWIAEMNNIELEASQQPLTNDGSVFDDDYEPEDRHPEWDGVPERGLEDEDEDDDFNMATPTDQDPDKKDGGRDPYVIRHTWNYFDFDAQRCSNAPNSFDYDNDGFPEHMCYWYAQGSLILFADKYDGVLKDGTNFTETPTHIWNDQNMNVFVDEGELTPINDPKLVIINNFKDGRLIDNGRYIYCIGESLTYGFEFECTKPTYWQTQEWMK